MANRDNKTFVHCPKYGCDAPLRGSWKQFETGEVEKATGLLIYKCPICHHSFTVNTLKVNAIPVPVSSVDEFYFVVVDTSSKEILFAVPSSDAFESENITYVHIPTIILNKPSAKCLYLETPLNTSIKELEVLCKSHLDGKIK